MWAYAKLARKEPDPFSQEVPTAQQVVQVQPSSARWCAGSTLLLGRLCSGRRQESLRTSFAKERPL